MSCRLKIDQQISFTLFEWITQPTSLKEMDDLQLIYSRWQILTGILPMGTSNNLMPMWMPMWISICSSGFGMTERKLDEESVLVFTAQDIANYTCTDIASC